MFSIAFTCSSGTIVSPFSLRNFRVKTLALSRPGTGTSPVQIPVKANSPPLQTSVHLDSLRVLEWHKVCDSVAAFAGTPLGQEGIMEQLWKLNVSYEESKALQSETTAAIEMLNYGANCLDFSALDVVKVKSAINCALRGSAMEGREAMAVASLLQFADALQLTLKAAIKEDAEWYNRFIPLTDVIKGMVINRSLIKAIQQVIDEDGSIKDSASSYLKRCRNQVRLLERKLRLQMENFLENESIKMSSYQVTNIDGRWCLKFEADQPTTFKGLLLSGGSGIESLVEPTSVVPLNDELQQARASVAKSEEDVLFKLTEKMRTDLVDIENLLNNLIQLDMVTARAKYSLAFGGTCPDLSFTEDKGGSFFVKDPSSGKKSAGKVSFSDPSEREWTVQLRRAYHPLLLQQHRENIQKARKDVSTASAEVRGKRLQGTSAMSNENMDKHLRSLEIRVAELDETHPVPIDILVTRETKVLIITGPNTGGKTISLKTVGLAALMAKAGLYVLASEPARIPWFDTVFADIGDEQSLAQSLSTFSGHLKQISGIRAQSTHNSLVLLDEVGAGTNPLEGAALGMSLLESFAESGALLTIATTHHGELKTLKYSNYGFENACVEFDEVNLKPTYKILWGVPGRSNAINIAERLGLPQSVLDVARALYGTASAEINGVIIDMERFKQDFHRDIHEAQHALLLSRELHEKLSEVNQKIVDYHVIQRHRKMREMSEIAARARSILQSKLREFRASAAQHSQNNTLDNNPISSENVKHSSSGKRIKLPEVGDVVHVPSLGKKVKVLKVEESKREIIVQANNMKLRLRLSEIETQQVGIIF